MYDPYSKSIAKMNGEDRIIAFCFGGGSYYDYVTLMSSEDLKEQKKTIIYGCDKLYSPNEFTQELVDISSL